MTDEQQLAVAQPTAPDSPLAKLPSSADVTQLIDAMRGNEMQKIRALMANTNDPRAAVETALAVRTADVMARNSGLRIWILDLLQNPMTQIIGGIGSEKTAPTSIDIKNVVEAMRTLDDSDATAAGLPTKITASMQKIDSHSTHVNGEKTNTPTSPGGEQVDDDDLFPPDAVDGEIVE